MSVMELINSMGPDAVLLTRNDDWLERQRQQTAAQMDQLANELRALMLAQRIKRLLQQKNLVAIQHLLRDEDGTIKNIVIRLLSLPEAMQMMKPSKDRLEEVGRIIQLETWAEDGYDLETAAALRTA